MIIDVQNYILKTMKNEIFSETPEINYASRVVLGNLKTYQKNVLEPITEIIQYNFLKKILAERIESKEIYLKNDRKDLADKEANEEYVIKKLMEELEEYLPKQLSEIDIRRIVEDFIVKHQNKGNVNIGMIMKEFKSYKNVDMGFAAKIAKEYI